MKIKLIVKSLALAGLMSTVILPAYADISPKDATDTTKNANDALYSQLPFSDNTDFTNAHKGFIAALPADAAGDWFGAGTGWGYAERIAVSLSGQDAGMLPHAQDLLSLARFAWERGEAIVADNAQPVYLRDKVATPKAR